MKDVVIVGPILLTGGVALEGLSHVGYRPGTPTTEYIFLLALLIVVLLVWYRMKLGGAERMRALELGIGKPEPTPVATPKASGPSAVGTLVGTPVGVAGIAWMTCLTTRCEPAFVWSIVGLLGVTAMVCGTFLLSRTVGSGRHDTPDSGLKPYPMDADGYDVVARRG